MPPQPGQQLAHYRLVEQIGEGGMGVVWRATDTSLGRDVAIKLLPEVLANDTERLQRFEREARVLASLNHPNIATIHGLHEALGESGSPQRFLVMELVEGEDLQKHIEREALPLERTIEIATQVALALETAHAQGIIHRDLKPANVQLTADGDAKVLDFGLAKALAPETASGEASTSLSMSPTMTSAGTAMGMILGTAGYMSPEQARGKHVDKRADLWAFGCLLFEMLTRRRCFEGETVSDTLASVLKEQPDLSLLPEDTPPAIRRLLRRCLTKDPRQRLGDASAARLELAEALEPAYPGEAPAALVEAEPAETLAGGRLPWMIVAAVALLAMVAMWFLGDRTPAPTASEPLKLSISIPPEMKLADDQESLLELSPDGSYLVFSGIEEDAAESSLYLRRLDDGTIVKLPDTLSAINPFFSPDSRWIGFFSGGQIKKLQIGGQTAVKICDNTTGQSRGASWGEDDRIVFPGHFSGALMQVPASGGEATPLTELDTERKERTHRWPQVVPGHDVVLFTVATTDSPEFYGDALIDAVSLSTGKRKTVFEGASFARYVSTGHLVIAREGFLFAVPFDIEKLEATGTEIPVVEGVMGAESSGVVYASIANNGLLAYVPGKPENPRKRLHWVHADGRNEPLPGIPTGGYVDPAVSPDGHAVAVSVAGERLHDIWVFDLERGERTRLTFEGENVAPVWTPDGKFILFYSIRDGSGATYVTAADGSGGERRFSTDEGEAVWATSVSPDGRLVALEVEATGGSLSDIYIKSFDDPEAEAVPFLSSPAEELQARFSPDGRWIVYTSDETGSYHVFVRPYPGPGGRWQITTDGGVDPRWSPDGRQINFRINREWWVVDVDPGDGAGQPFRVGTPRQVRSGLTRATLERVMGLSPDGKVMLIPLSDEDRSVPDEVTVVVDWLAELQRQVPL